MGKLSINTVTVIGVTGTMGANIAGIFASFGNAKVFCVGRDISKVEKTIPRIIQSVKADCIGRKLVPADFSMLEKCVGESDLVFESSAENLEIKAAIAHRVGCALKAHAISCTGTSGLSISKLAECYPQNLRGHFFGVHMFNPPYSMPLCEFTKTEYSEKALAEELKDYLQNILYRTVVEVKDSPAFLGNRIGFQFINEALQMADKYRDNGGIDYIDAILGPFTGRAMAPLATSDFVGLDVHKAIVENIFQNTNDYAHETFVLPEFVKKLINIGNLGRKSGCGLYQLIKYDNGLKRQTVLDIGAGVYRDPIPYAFPFAIKMKSCLVDGDYLNAFKHLVYNHSFEAELCLRFLLKYIVYSLYTAANVGYSDEAADDVMAMGFNWCPPQAMSNALGLVANVSSLIKERLPDICSQIDVDWLFANSTVSRYDYRPFFRIGK